LFPEIHQKIIFAVHIFQHCYNVYEGFGQASLALILGSVKLLHRFPEKNIAHFKSGKK